MVEGLVVVARDEGVELVAAAVDVAIPNNSGFTPAIIPTMAPMILNIAPTIPRTALTP